MPKHPSADQKSRDISYLLVDRQLQVLKNFKQRYTRNIEILNTSNGVESNSTVEIIFDPSYQTVSFHDISLIRNGQRLNRLIGSDLRIFRQETDRDKLIYNENLQVSLIIFDVRIGDILDYSYSVSGLNPALGNHFFSRSRQKFSVPVQRIFQRVVLGNDISHSKKAHAGAVEPVEKQLKEKKQYVWEFDNQPALILDDDRPYWDFGSPIYEISSFQDWPEVSRFFAPYYSAPQQLSPELQQVVEAIRRDNSTSAERLRAALEFVQRDIRYLGIELGEGGYIPRSPETTLQRRFGDCKDMTLLLLTLLSSLEIESAPILVNTDEHAGVGINIASYAVFDHVLVMASLGGEQYFLDPTRGQQLGTLDTVDQAYFGSGLPLFPKGSDLIAVQPKGAEWAKDFSDTFDLISDPDAVGFTAKLKYFGAEADSTKSWLMSDGEQVVEQSLLDYFKDKYPTIRTVTPMKVEVSHELAMVVLLLDYAIDKAWKDYPDDGVIAFETYPYELQSDLPKFVGASRTSPFAIKHPIKTRHIQNMLMDDSWTMEGVDERVENESFRYSRRSTFKDFKFAEIYEYRSKSDSISAENFSNIMLQVNSIRDETGLFLQQETNIFSGISNQQIKTIILIWGLIAVLFALFAIVRKIRAYQKNRQTATL